MSELTAKIRGMYHVSKTDLLYIRLDALRLCDDHERLEAEVERLEDVVVRQNLTAATLHDEHLALRVEHARVCNDFALLVQESGREGRELDRLEGLIMAWVKARGDDESEASKDLWAEATRLAREKT